MMIKKITFVLSLCAAMGSASLANSANWTTGSVNFREGPGTYYTKLGTIGRCVQVKITDTSNGWYRIAWKGHWGWVAASYITTQDSYCGGYSPTRKHTPSY